MINLVHPDPVFKSVLVAKVINKIMLDGKKTIAEKIVYGAIQNVIEGIKLGQYQIKFTEHFTEFDAQDGAKLIQYVISKISPNVEVRSKRVGGANYQVPFNVTTKGSMSLPLCWLVVAVRKRSEKTSIERLEKEIIDILHDRGMAIKKRTDVHKMAESNKAFAHFANNG